MSNDIFGHQQHVEEVCKHNATRVASIVKGFEPGRWTFLGSGDEEKWYGSLTHFPEEAELYGEDYDARIRCEWTPFVQVFNSTITKVCSNVKEVKGSSIQNATKPKQRGTAVEDHGCRQPARYLRSSGNVV